jgi:hypothetical protein
MRLWKVDVTGYRCANRSCLHSEEYTYSIIGNTHFVKPGTIALIVNDDEVYCRGCIDILHKQLMPILNSRLWAFQ